MLSKHQFQLLLNLKNKAEKTNQRLISEELGFSLGTVNKLIQEAEENGWISSEYEVTEKGLKPLEPYRVENAIIMAAGMSTRFAPLSYETPKGLLVVKATKRSRYSKNYRGCRIHERKNVLFSRQVRCRDCCERRLLSLQ